MHVECKTILGQSPAIQQVIARIQSVGPCDTNVQIRGESGVGKELVARALHAGRGQGQFVPLNCAAIPEHLLESELFGYRKSAFTGAEHDRAGLLEEAHGGTLFLDEIGDLPLHFQAKLLRALDQGEVRRVGDTRTRYVRFRLVTATHKDLRLEVQRGRFRADLFWRINGISIYVPPLRERSEDIPELVAYFLQGRPISSEALAILSAHSWPGNVRELKSAILAAGALANGHEIQRDHVIDCLISDTVDSIRRAGIPSPTASLDFIVEWHILRVMEEVGGKRSRAAEILGIDTKTLWRKLKAYGRETTPEAQARHH